jgi:6-phosphogluconolactonase
MAFWSTCLVLCNDLIVRCSGPLDCCVALPKNPLSAWLAGYTWAVSPSPLLRLVAGLIAALLAGCGGGGTAHYTLGGTISGLVGAGLVLGDSKGGQFKASSNGSFSLPDAYASGSAYSVSVSTQPTSSPPQYCAVTNSSGTFSSANISNVAVSCHGPFVYFSPSAGDILANTIDVSTGALLPVAGSPFTNGVGGENGNFTVDAAARFAYVAYYDVDYISVLAIDPGTGALAPAAGSLAGDGPQIVAIHPSGKFAYTANFRSGDVSAYAIDAATGALTPVSGSPFPAGMGAGTGFLHGPSVLIDPSGSFAYVINTNANSISAYLIDASTGALTAVAGSPFATGAGPVDGAMDARGQSLYVVALDGIDAFTVDSTSGALTTMAGSPYGPLPLGSSIPALARITIDPSGRFIYVVCVNTEVSDVNGQNPSVLASYAIDPTTGQLLALPASPQQINPERDQALTFAPAGAFAYLAEPIEQDIAVYSFDNATGALMPVSTLVDPNQPASLAIDPSGTFAYGLSNGDEMQGILPFVDTYTINMSTGALTPVSSMSLPVGVGFYGYMTIAIPH